MVLGLDWAVTEVPSYISWAPLVSLGKLLAYNYFCYLGSARSEHSMQQNWPNTSPGILDNTSLRFFVLCMA